MTIFIQFSMSAHANANAFTRYAMTDRHNDGDWPWLCRRRPTASRRRPGQKRKNFSAFYHRFMVYIIFIKAAAVWLRRVRSRARVFATSHTVVRRYIMHYTVVCYLPISFVTRACASVSSPVATVAPRVFSTQVDRGRIFSTFAARTLIVIIYYYPVVVPVPVVRRGSRCRCTGIRHTRNRTGSIYMDRYTARCIL